MKSRLLVSAMIGAAFLAASPRSQAANMSLPRSTPEAQGVSSQAICDFIEAADKIDTLHSFMIVRHGQVWSSGLTARPGDRGLPGRHASAGRLGRRSVQGRISDWVDAGLGEEDPVELLPYL